MKQWIIAGLAILLLILFVIPDSAECAKKKRKKRSPISSSQQEKLDPEQKPVPLVPAKPVGPEAPAEPGTSEQPLQEAPQPAVEQTPPTPLETEENREREAEEAQRLMELFLRNQSVFIRKGELMMELMTLYNRNSRDEFQPVPGGAALVKSTTRFIDTTLILRYGLLTDGLELDVFAPVFVHAEQKTDFGLGESTQTRDDFGDLGAALRYEVWYEQGNRPTLVLDVSGKSRTGGAGLTGSGTWNAGGGVTVLKTIDPVVFFGRLGYIHNFASETRDLGNIFEYRLGMGFSLNDKVSFNMQFTGAHIGQSRIVGQGVTELTGPIAPTQVAARRLELLNLVFTTTVIITKKLSIEPIIGVPLTSESFAIFGVRVPYRF